MRPVPLVLTLLLLVGPLAGCLSEPTTIRPPQTATDDPAPFLGYVPDLPDRALKLVQESVLLAGDGVTIHGRVVRPEGDGPFPVIIQYTPYTAPGRHTVLNNLIEPAVQDATGEPLDLDGSYVSQFVRRGYAFVFADVRGTGDSSGCLDLRGPKDIADQHHLIDHFATQDWSNGKVAFIGASYPGSTSHMAALTENPHLAAVVPIVASTSFYHYHHNDGVPYNGNHALGGTNSGYTAFATAPTMNPQHPHYLDRHIEEAECPHVENMVEHGGMDQSGAYYDWWQERDLRPLVDRVAVPVLMAQGLADWNVKPDHIATWYNDLDVPKTLIAGQWGHAMPRSVCAEDQKTGCDDEAPYQQWWAYVTAFFDTYLKDIDTGMFGTDVAWVQDNDGGWHRSSDWPILPENREEVVFHLHADGTLAAEADHENDTLAWTTCPRDPHSKGQTSKLGNWLRADWCAPLEPTQLVFQTEALEQDLLVSGVPLLNITLGSSTASTHLVWVLEVVDAEGEVSRENYGYLNPIYRDGIENPAAIPTDGTYTVEIDGYPQEDLVPKGSKIRLTLRSHDDGRTIEEFDAGTNTLHLGADSPAFFTLPMRPDHLSGVRLDDA